MKVSYVWVVLIGLLASSCVPAVTNASQLGRSDPGKKFIVPPAVTKDFTKGMSKDDLFGLHYEIVDLDKDGVPEIIYFAGAYCGNTGCVGSVYAKKGKGGKYCFVGTIMEDDVGKSNLKLRKLECSSEADATNIVQ